MICEDCKKELKEEYYFNNNYFCNKNCYKKGVSVFGVLKRNCKYEDCKKEFMVSTNHKQFCSSNCRITYFWKNQYIKKNKMKPPYWTKNLVPETTDNNPVEIDINLVRSLRLQGKTFEANELVKAYQKSKLDNKVQLSKELKVQEHKILKTKSQSMHRCLVCFKKANVKRMVVCLDCRIRRRELDLNKKEQGVKKGWRIGRL